MKIDLERSIEYQLDNLSRQDVERYCEIAEMKPVSVGEFKVWFSDRSWDGLAQLLTARFGEQMGVSLGERTPK